MSLEGFTQWTGLVPEPVLLVSDDGTVLQVNTAAAQQFGIAAEPCIALTDLVDDPRDHIERHLREWLRSGEVLPASLSFRRPGADPAPTQVRVTSIRPRQLGGRSFVVIRLVDRADRLGQFTALTVAVRQLQLEVEQHRHTAQLLRESQSTLRAIVELTTASVFAKDLDGRYLVVNPRAAEIIGHPPDEILGRTDAELLDSELGASFTAQDRAALDRRGPVTIEFRFAGAEGERTYQSVVVPLTDGDGTVCGVAGIASDVTERARAEELLRRRTKQLTDAQRIARIGSWSWEPSTGAIEISPELNEILQGDPGDTWTIERLVQLTYPDDLPIASKALINARAGEPADQVFRIRREDDTIGWLQIRSDPRPNAVGRVTGTIQDVTERETAERRRVELEHRLQQSQRLESAGQLAGGVAHDFNNLLAVMGIHAELLGDELPAAHAAGEHLEQLRQAIERASALTRQLLLFSRREPSDLQQIDLNGVIVDVTALLQRTLGEHIELETRLASTLPAIRADRGRIEQVLVNLAINARDAMASGGTLTISTNGMHLETGDPRRPASGDTDEFVRLSVRDTGIGMPADVVDHALEPFFTTKSREEGSGLGLATVHGVVLQGGGDIHIRSTPGLGTTVEILLPAAPVAPEVEAVDAVEPDELLDGHGETILVVEDLQPLGEVVAALLAQAGYRPLLAIDGREALEIAAREERIDVLLTDVVMPHMSGREVAQRLRAIDPAVPVVFMSGYTQGILDAWPADADGQMLLAKPFSTSELLTMIASAMYPDR